MTENVLVIGRVRAKAIKNAIDSAYNNVVYISSRDIKNNDLTGYSNFDLIFATNPYKNKYLINDIVDMLGGSNFNTIFYLNTYITDAKDRYQFLKQEEGEALSKELDIISLNIPFIFSCEHDKSMLKSGLAGGFSAPYLYVKDIANALQEKTTTENSICFLDSYNLSAKHMYLSKLRNILWKNPYVKYNYINLFFKIIEKVILKLYRVNISLCYLKETRMNNEKQL